MRKAVFLDRDGLINDKAPEHEYIKCWSEFHFMPGVPAAIRQLNKAGYLVLIITNQQGVAKGMLRLADVEEMHCNMQEELAAYGAHIDGIYVCPHKSGVCSCRKPDIGLFLQAEQKFPIDRTRSFMVGDSQTDIEAGNRYGVRSILTTNLQEAVREIMEETV